jgi:RasGEF domain
MVVWFSTVSRWAATELVCTPNPKHRVAVLKRLILMAKHCFKLRAYNTLLELLAGLNLTSVQRLKSTWEVGGVLGLCWVRESVCVCECDCVK